MGTTITTPTTPVDRFDPITTPAPDWSAGANWSDGAPPGAGTIAAITGVTAAIDPGVTLEQTIELGPGTAGGGAIVGNGGAVVFGGAAELVVEAGADADLFASDSLVNQGTISLAPGASLVAVVDIGARTGLAGAPPPDFANDGTISVATGANLDIAGTEFLDRGTVVVDGGTLNVAGGAVAGGGTISLVNGAVLRFGDAVSDQTFVFGTGGADLVFADTADLAGITLTGSTASDTVTGFGTATSSGVKVSEPVAQFGAPPPCFATGTMILTPSGARRVEALREGDLVVTGSGGGQPVVWTGSRRVTVGADGDCEALQPVRIEPGAIAPGVPARAVRLSPDHGVHLAGGLIPAKLLVNGATIRRETGCVAVIYHHLELARHDLLLADGLACESYLDTGNRATLGGLTIRAKRWDCDACAPLITTGPRLAAARRIVHARALALGFLPTLRPEIDLLVHGRSARRLPAAAGLTRFALPRGTREALLRSASFVPAEFDPASEDRRRLGVALRAIESAAGRAAPEAVLASGSHPRGAGDVSLWTTGDALLHFTTDPHHLTLHLAALPLAWQRPATPGAN